MSLPYAFAHCAGLHDTYLLRCFHLQDTVTAPGGSRNGLALGLLALSVLILLPALTGLDTAGTTNITL